MKCVGIQYLEAVRKLKTSGIQLKRTLHICFVPGMESKAKYSLKVTHDIKQISFAIFHDICLKKHAFKFNKV